MHHSSNVDSKIFISPVNHRIVIFLNVDLKILEIKLLSELKGTLLNSITIELPARLVKNGFIQTLSEFMPPAHQHKAELSFKIYDSELDKSVRLRSRRKPTITEELIDFLSENDEVSFKINE